jgi:restriction system protein
MLLVAFMAPSFLPAASSLAQSPMASPTISPQASPTQEAASTTVAAPIPNEVKAYALVSHGGNLRAAASMQGEVLALIKIADRLELLGKSEDGEWLQVKTEQDLAGWVHKTLLSIDPEVEAILTNIP